MRLGQKDYVCPEKIRQNLSQRHSRRDFLRRRETKRLRSARWIWDR
jgi:hypothetical protein